jgi:hypothetical protein
MAPINRQKAAIIRIIQFIGFRKRKIHAIHQGQVWKGAYEDASPEGSCPLITASGESDRVWPTAESMYRHYATCFLESRETDESGNLFFLSFYAFRINRANATPSTGMNFLLSSRSGLVAWEVPRRRACRPRVYSHGEGFGRKDVACASALGRRMGILRIPALLHRPIATTVLKTSQGCRFLEILILLMIPGSDER